MKHTLTKTVLTPILVNINSFYPLMTPVKSQSEIKHFRVVNAPKCNRSIPSTEKYGIETASSIGPKLWEKVPPEI